MSGSFTIWPWGRRRRWWRWSTFWKFRLMIGQQVKRCGILCFGFHVKACAPHKPHSTPVCFLPEQCFARYTAPRPNHKCFCPGIAACSVSYDLFQFHYSSPSCRYLFYSYDHLIKKSTRSDSLRNQNLPLLTYQHPSSLSHTSDTGPNVSAHQSTMVNQL